MKLPIKNKQKLYWDIGDIVFYFKHHTTPTGIQRVQIELIKRSLADKAFSKNIIFLWYEFDMSQFYIIPHKYIYEIIAITEGNKNKGEIESLFIRIFRSKESPVFNRNDTLFIGGSFWTNDQYERLIYRTKLKGIKIGLYVYDLIPIEMKHHCTIGLSQTFEKLLNRLIPLCDFFFTISEYVAGTLSKYIKEKSAPITPLPLSNVFDIKEENPKPSSNLSQIKGQKFCLFPSTFESRKNTEYAFNIWQLLLEKYESKDIPLLVFSGREGWLVNDIMYKIKASNYLNEKIILLKGVSDKDLTFLYQNALFTLFPSYGEGWGLPVGESLSFNTPCITSDNTSIPEVGGKVANYINPYNTIEGFEIAEKFIFDTGYLSKTKKQITKHFKIRTWDDVYKDFKAALHKTKELTIQNKVPLSTLKIDNEFKVIQNNYNSYLFGWSDIEEWGIWAIGEESYLSFNLETLHSKKEVFIAFNYQLPYWYKQLPINIEINDIPYKNIILSQDTDTFSLCLPKENEDTTLNIRFFCTDIKTTPEDNRHITFGLKNIFITNTTPSNYVSPSLPITEINKIYTNKDDAITLLGKWGIIEEWKGNWSLENNTAFFIHLKSENLKKKYTLSLNIAIPPWFKNEQLTIFHNNKPILREKIKICGINLPLLLKFNPVKERNIIKFSFVRTKSGEDHRNIHIGLISYEVSSDKPYK